VFLGTAGMVPTKERNVQSLYLEHEGEGILLDCGEGTQRQLSLAGLSAQKISTILISHWHGDHVGGLLSLLQTIGNFASEEKTLQLFGPVGTKEYFSHLTRSCAFDTPITVHITELSFTTLTTFYETEDYALQAIQLEHSIPCLGYRFEKKAWRTIEKDKLPPGLKGPDIGRLQKGETVQHGEQEIHPEDISTVVPATGISFIFDTELCAACEELAKNTHTLVSEAVYTHDLLHKAKQYQHLTAYQVAQLASRMHVQQLILTHFSQRYKETLPLEQDAKRAFTNVICAQDFLEIQFDF
jgi:ribonuclease Z